MNPEDLILPKQLYYVPTSPIDYVIQLKTLMKTVPLEKIAKVICIETQYLENLIDILERYAQGIKKCIDVNKLSITEAAKALEISEKEINKYLRLIND